MKNVENVVCDDSVSATVRAIERLSDRHTLAERQLREIVEVLAEWVNECVGVEATLPRGYEIRLVREPGIHWPLVFNAAGECLQRCRGVAPASTDALLRFRDDLQQGWLEELHGWLNDRVLRFEMATKTIEDINGKTDL